MFTGLIEEVGSVRWIRADERGTQLQIAAPRIAADLRKGDSVSVNGCCLTGDQRFATSWSTLRPARGNARSDEPAHAPAATARSIWSARLPPTERWAAISSKATSIARSRALSFDANGADYRLEVELPGGFRALRRLQGLDRAQRNQPNDCGSSPGELCRLDYSAHPARRRISTNLQAGDLLNLEFDHPRQVRRANAAAIDPRQEHGLTTTSRPRPKNDRRDRAEQDLEIQA